jgi:NitT/TauT family transport system permease protein
VVLQTIPILALVPLIGFWFDFNFRSRVIVCVLIAIFRSSTTRCSGLLSADQGQHDLFTLTMRAASRGSGGSSCPQACPRSSRASASRPASRWIGAIVGDFFFRQGDPGLESSSTPTDHASSPRSSSGRSSSLRCSGSSCYWVFGFIGNRVVGAWHETARKQS